MLLRCPPRWSENYDSNSTHNDFTALVSRKQFFCIIISHSSAGILIFSLSLAHHKAVLVKFLLSRCKHLNTLKTKQKKRSIVQVRTCCELNTCHLLYLLLVERKSCNRSEKFPSLNIIQRCETRIDIENLFSFRGQASNVQIELSWRRFWMSNRFVTPHSSHDEQVLPTSTPISIISCAKFRCLNLPIKLLALQICQDNA